VLLKKRRHCCATTKKAGMSDSCGFCGKFKTGLTLTVKLPFTQNHGSSSRFFTGRFNRFLALKK